MLWNFYHKLKFVILIFCIFCVLCPIAKADENIEENFSEIPQDISQNLEENIQNPENVKDKHFQILEKLNPKSIISDVFSSFKDTFKNLASPFLCIIGVIILSSVFGCMSESFGKNSTVFDNISLLILILFIIIPLDACTIIVGDACKKMCAFMLSFVPSMTALYTSSGCTSTALASSALCSFGISALQLISTYFVIPAFRVCVSLLCALSICKGFDISGVFSFFKTLSFWCLGLIMTLFCGILSIQTQITTSADTLAIKGVKFSFSRLVPVAGGMISDSLKTVMSGAVYLKGIAGGAGILYILYVALPPLCCIGAIKLFLSLSGMCAKITNLKPQSTLLDGLSSLLNLLFSACLCCSLSFIIVLTIFMKCSIDL